MTSAATAPLAQPLPEPASAPRHVAIIMDGNGRWAAQRGRPRSYGHKAGVEALRKTVEAAGALGIEILTVYAFSTENWRRPPEEIDTLFGLLRLYVRADLARLEREGVKVRIIGRREGLPADIHRLIDHVHEVTGRNAGRILQIALNYGGQDELVRVVQELAAEAASGALAPGAITKDLIHDRLDTAGLPDPDLVIRTSGEMRISNFMIWQAAYAEFITTDVLWPDFDRSHLEAALDEYRRRERRFGGL
jgi:undecaprenyl diphosphate synthase